MAHRLPRKRSGIGFWLLSSALIAALCLVPAQPAWSVVEPVINEFVFNHTGTDEREFVEIYGAPGMDYTGLTILEIEGDGSYAGIVDGVFQVGITDASGYWTAGFFNNMLENGTVTLLLVWDFTGSQGDDLDTDNDGVLDATPWSAIADDVAVSDGGSSDWTYASVTLNVGFDGIPYTPGGASRIPNGTDTDSVSDWVRNDFDGAGLPGFEGTPSVGEALNTPGSENELVVPVGDPIINEFVADLTGLDDHEYVEIYGDPDTDYSRFRIIEIEGDGANSGLIDGIFPVGTTDGGGFWWTGFMESELENGSITLLLVENFTGHMGQDLDTDNDGVLDAMPWGRLVDDVASLNGGETDWVYSTTVLAPDFDGSPYQPGGASRIPNGVDTDSVGDWMRNDYSGYGLPGYTGTPDPNEAVNTPGVMNEPVVDDTPPVITVVLNRTVLWPPNHKMADIHATVTVTDNFDPSPTFTLVSVESSEPDNGKGDGNTVDDVQGVGDADPDVDFQLRAERRGGGNGREYTITYMATDASGNTATVSVAVRVPHDHSGWAMASAGFVPDGTGFDGSSDRFALVIPSRPTTTEWDEAGNPILVEGYDATEIDVHYVYVGNEHGALRPEESRLLDVDGDGLMDLAVFYPVADAVALQLALSDESVREGRIGVKRQASTTPIGLHYEIRDGTEYLVGNILDLGSPVNLAVEWPGDFSREGAGDPGDAALVTAMPSIYPNPFSPATTISFELRAWENVRLCVFDARGRLLRTLKDEALGPGRHYVDWDGEDDSGRQVATGLYFVRFESDSRQVTCKAVKLQ